MKNRAYIISFLIILGFIFMGYNYVVEHNKARSLQGSIDAKFKFELGQARDSFSMEMNDYTYRSVLSSVSNAASSSELTSYEKQNDDLDISLYNLYLSLREDKSKDKVLSRADDLRDIFAMLVTDPSSREATDRLIRIAGESGAPTSTESSSNNRIDDSEDNRFSYLEQLSPEKQIAFAEFKAERDLQRLYEFTPEDMVIAYLYCLSVGDPDLIYAITYNGGKLPDQDTFREEYFEYASNRDSETAVHYRHYDSIKVDKRTEKENEVTVIVTAGVGLMTHSLALGAKKEDNVWKLDIYHLIDHYKKEENARTLSNLTEE